MTFRFGLTGSIGMGKSTTAAFFADEGCAVWDADAAVARLYGKGGAAIAPIQSIFPDAVVDGVISRDKLRAILRDDPTALAAIEKIVHPLVRQDRAAFGGAAASDIIVFDIPLLFETGAETEMDAIACVSVSKEVQRNRVLARGTMTEADLDLILSKQMPNDEKCARADYIVETDTLDRAREQVKAIVTEIRNR